MEEPIQEKTEQHESLVEEVSLKWDCDPTRVHSDASEEAAEVLVLPCWVAVSLEDEGLGSLAFLQSRLSLYEEGSREVQEEQLLEF